MHHQAKRCLIIPDVHQDIAWAERVLASEPEVDRIVFLGDYFDSRQPAKYRAGVAATCAWLNAAREHLGDRAVFLLGNHDVQYLEAKPACDRHRTPRFLGTKCGAAFTHNTAKRIARDLAPEFWRDARLFVGVNGWLDWDDEFADALPLPQIVGHTSDESDARRRARSWCLDGAQSSYSVLTAAGLIVRSA